MTEFLKSVVKHYLPVVVNDCGQVDALGLTDYLFVFPNRRSGLFFNKYLLEETKMPIFAPNMTTISELFPRLNDGRQLRVPDRIEQLFYLYEIYSHISGSNETFDAFLFWGEMLLGDFNDADKYLVDVRMLFENVRDLKDIEETFSGLDPEQIKVIRTFWTNFNPYSHAQSKEVFRETWKILYQLYNEFRTKLLNDGLAYDGMLQRLIVDDLRHRALTQTNDDEKARLERLLGRKVVFVGLTALSKTDMALMEHLSRYGVAEFCWDYADPRLTDPNSHASYFRSSTIDIFPNVLSEEELRNGLVPYNKKHFEVIEVPSGVGQTVQAARILKEWQTTQGFDPFRTAVILPDEKMLLPMLYSVPKEFEPFNVTMGYSLKATTIATFIDNLAALQANVQRNKDAATFYHKNVQTLLSTNYLLKMTDGKAEELAEDIVKNKRYRVAESAFRGNMLLEKVFRQCMSGRDCLNYLDEILGIFAHQAEAELAATQAEEADENEDLFGEQRAEERSQGIFSEVEREFLFTYKNLVKNLREKMEKFGTEINVATFFTLLHKLAQGETVAFSGEPLSGLQVMGVLETRGLDFDKLIILSMNEGVFPAKPLTNTFVPMNLRSAFGMPTQAHRDAVFAYHFYRLISRAKDVVMIYDSRSDSMKSGEQSRYIKQLSYLYGGELNLKTVQYNIGEEEAKPIVVAKDEKVMAQLNQCVTGIGNRRFSASSLKRYIECRLRFYFEFVEGLREEIEIEDNVDDRVFGNILHKTMEDIYRPMVGKIVSFEHLDNVLLDKEYLRRTIEKNFRKEMGVDEMTGFLNLVKESILTYVIDILEHDKLLAPFEYVSSEDRKSYEYKMQDAEGNFIRTVNIDAVFDRIDRVNGTLRIVDYKTGGTKLNGSRSKLLVPEIKTIFSPDSKCSNEAFQVMLYSILYNNVSPISPNLYFVRNFHQNPELSTELLYEPENKEPITDFNVYKQEFKEAFDQLLAEIFDPTKPFTQTDDKNHCRNCQLKEICRRIDVATKKY